MAAEEPDFRELFRRFVAQRRELGDGFWPMPPEMKNDEALPSASASAAPLRADASSERSAHRASGSSRGERDSAAKPGEPVQHGIVAPVPQTSLLGDDVDTRAWEGLTLVQFEREISGCRLCQLSKTRTNFVFGDGNPDADLFFIGEAPGEEEDKQGKPFVGRAGKLLTKMILAMKLRREDVYIGNVLKCRPPNNRTPLSSEMEACMPYLEHQIRLIRPKIICALGRVAAQALLQSSESLTRMRGKWHDYLGIKTMVTYHPAALLRNPAWKRDAWDDLKRLRKELDGVEL